MRSINRRRSAEPRCLPSASECKSSGSDFYTSSGVREQPFTPSISSTRQLQHNFASQQLSDDFLRPGHNTTGKKLLMGPHRTFSSLNLNTQVPKHGHDSREESKADNHRLISYTTTNQ